VAPLLADLGNLPPLLVTACEFDPLLDDSTRLVARLKEAGTPHRYAAT
jgi:acetyl esterase/lipase